MEALHEALHEALYTEALHNSSAYDGSAYDGSTTEALYKSFVQTFVYSVVQSLRTQSFVVGITRS